MSAAASAAASREDHRECRALSPRLQGDHPPRQNVNSYGKDLAPITTLQTCSPPSTPFPRLLAPLYVEPAEGRDQQTFRHDAPASTLQSTPPPRPVRCDRVLEAMNRPIRAQSTRNDRLRANVMPSMVLTSDVIIGFPERPRRSDADCRSCRKDAVRRALHFYFLPASRHAGAKMTTPSRARKSRSGLKSSSTRRTPSREKARSLHRRRSSAGRRESDDEAFPSPRARRQPPRAHEGDKALIAHLPKRRSPTATPGALRRSVRNKEKGFLMKVVI